MMDILTIIANILIFLSGLITFACFGCFFKLINKVKTDPVKLPVKVYYIMAIILYITAVLAIWAAHTLKEESISPFSTLIALIICTVTAFNLLDIMGKNQLLSWKWFALLLLDFAVMAMLSYMQLKA